MTVMPLVSMTRAPEGMAIAPTRPIASIRLPFTKTTALSRGGPPYPSTSLPPARARVSERASADVVSTQTIRTEAADVERIIGSHSLHYRHHALTTTDAEGASAIKCCYAMFEC